MTRKEVFGTSGRLEKFDVSQLHFLFEEIRHIKNEEFALKGTI